MVTLAGKAVELTRPRLMFAAHRLLSELLASTGGSNADSLLALGGIVGAMVPTSAGPMPMTIAALREWSAAAYDALATAGASDKEIVDAGLAAITWLVDQLPRPAVIEGVAGNSLAQTERPTGT